MTKGKTSKEITWKNNSGQNVVARLTSTYRKTVSADGQLVEIDCCEWSESYSAGDETGYYLTPLVAPITKGSETYSYRAGRIAIPDSAKAKIDAARHELKSDPRWAAGDTDCSPSHHLCPECGTSCYGDCRQ